MNICITNCMFLFTHKYMKEGRYWKTHWRTLATAERGKNDDILMKAKSENSQEICLGVQSCLQYIYYYTKWQ